jgi:hypothetical protein
MSIMQNHEQYDSMGGSICGRQVCIEANGVKITASVADRCAGCPYGYIVRVAGYFLPKCVFLIIDMPYRMGHLQFSIISTTLTKDL